MGPIPPGMITQIQTRSPTGTSDYDGPKSTGSLTPNGSSSCSGVKRDKKKDQKTTRVRTVLNEKQLHTLRTCYQANPRPDALMKEQLVEMTGLSPRVIRVWFQNKRCKDKKKHIMMKQAQHAQEKVINISIVKSLFNTGVFIFEGGFIGSLRKAAYVKKYVCIILYRHMRKNIFACLR